MPSDINMTEEELSAFTGLEISLAERNELRSERKFALAFFPPFSQEELSDRERAIRASCQHTDRLASANGNEGWAKGVAAIPVAWVASPAVPEDWTERARQIGEHFFGKEVFKSYVKDTRRIPVRTTEAVVFPNSQYLNTGEYWEKFTGLKNVEKTKKTMDGIHTLRVVGGALFPFHQENLQQEERAFRAMALQDGFAICAYHYCFGGSAEAVRDFVDARRMRAFLNLEPHTQWTASACEETLMKETFPSSQEVRTDIRQIQIRAGLNLQTKGKDLLKEDNSLVKSLAQIIVNKKSFTSGAYREGLKVLAGYENLCPSEAKEVLRPLGFSVSNPTFGLS